MMQPRTVTFRALAVVAGAFAALSLMGPAAEASSDGVPRDLDAYVLFATEKISIKGANGDPSRGVITGGSVGVNNPGEYKGDPRLGICNNGPMTMDAGTQVVADTMRLTSHCTVWDVYANHVTGSGWSAHSGPTPFAAPIIAPADLPKIPPFACDAGAPITVADGGTIDLAPGPYGELWLKDGATLTLHEGTYTFCNWKQGKNVTVHATNDTVVQIVQWFSSKNNATIAPGACRMQWWINANGAYDDNKSAVSVGDNSEVWGRWWNLNGKTNLGHGSTIHGQHLAVLIGSDWNTTVHGCTPQTATTTTTAQQTTTTTIADESTTTTTAAGESTTTTTGTGDETTTTLADATTTTVSSDDTTPTTLVASVEAFGDVDRGGFFGGTLPFTGGASLPIAGAGVVALGTGAVMLCRRRVLSRR